MKGIRGLGQSIEDFYKKKQFFLTCFFSVYMFTLCDELKLKFYSHQRLKGCGAFLVVRWRVIFLLVTKYGCFQTAFDETLKII